MSFAATAPTTTQQRSPKILERHVDRLAMVYIRQSSMQQVRQNQESTKLQYSLTEVAQRFGWNQDRVVVIDDDLGLSGASAQGRHGFQRLLAEVALDHVGIILGVEMSRLARSNKDWHQLLELCARFGTLIADLDGLYDPGLYNDRLLLGLKGTMSEAELHILRQRLWQGKLQKARRGELNKPLPAGYLRKPDGEVVLDPDEEVQASVRLVFETFTRIGTLQGTLRHLVRNGVQIGRRRRIRPDIGKLEWHPINRNRLADFLRNPIYAGAYVYGRRQTDPRRQKPGQRASGRTSLVAPQQWQACVHDHYPAYVSWKQYEEIQRRLKANRDQHSMSVGSPRNGEALLSGLVVCSRCDLTMSVQYATAKNRRAYRRYVCNHASTAYGADVCSGLSGTPLDEAISELALSALAPAALQVSMRVSEDLERERTKIDALWQKKLQRARYEVERAERQYHVVEPENRLVARSLERAWEEKLQAERALIEENDRRQRTEPRTLSAAERQTIHELAANLPKLWNAKTTTPADKKAILRLLIHQVRVAVDERSEWVDVVVRWNGGHETTTRIRRPVGKLTSLENHGALVREIRELRQAGYTAEQIAEKLNDDGWTTPTQRNAFNERLIRMMISRHCDSIPRGPKRPPSDNPNEIWLPELAKKLRMPQVTLYGWIRNGDLKTRKLRGQRVAILAPGELRRLQSLRRRRPTPGVGK